MGSENQQQLRALLAAGFHHFAASNHAKRTFCVFWASASTGSAERRVDLMVKAERKSDRMFPGFGLTSSLLSQCTTSFCRWRTRTHGQRSAVWPDRLLGWVMKLGARIQRGFPDMDQPPENRQEKPSACPHRGRNASLRLPVCVTGNAEAGLKPLCPATGRFWVTGWRPSQGDA